MTRITGKRKPSSFFLIMGCVGLFAILTGFSQTFIIPLSLQKFEAPGSIYIHAFFTFSWVMLFTIQSLLIRSRQHKLHIQLGIAGVIIALGAVITLIPVALYIIERDLKLGLGETAYSNSVSLLTTGLMFLIMVGFGLYFRKRPTLHKRLLLLATIVLLWPAWFRFRHFFPQVPRPDIWFGLVLADSLMVVAWFWDRTQHKQIHPVLLWGGIAVMLEQSLEVFLYDTGLWRSIGKFLYQLF